MYFLLASYVISACVNIYIAVLLSTILGRTIYFLKKQFGGTFKKETSSITRVLVIFAMTFIIRAIYEGVLYYRSMLIINQIPSQYELSLETMVNGLVTQ